MSEYMKNERIKNKVAGMLTTIVAGVDPNNVLDHLIERRIVDIEYREKIMNKETRKDRCRALIYHLLECSHNEAFIVFRKALEEHYHWIVERIDAIDTYIGNQDDFNLRIDQLEKELIETKMKLQEANRRTEHLDDLQKTMKTQLIVAKREIENLKEENKILKQELERKTKLECLASEFSKRIESCIIVVGFDNVEGISQDVMEININGTNEISTIGQLPPRMNRESAAVVYGNSLFVTGVGENCDKIWKFDARSSKWKNCNTMIRGRRRHSVAFVDHVLYICGGWVDAGKITLNDVEAYDTIGDTCTTVGKLVQAVQSAGNCVPFKSSLYIFGGSNAKDEDVDYVQVYDTKKNFCTLLSERMPLARCLLRAVLWENKAILLGCDNCFIYNLDTRTWQMRERFKTGVRHFGVIVHDGKLFVIGGVACIVDIDGNKKFTYRDDVRRIPIANVLSDESFEWLHHAKLPKHTAVFSLGKMEFLIQ